MSELKAKHDENSRQITDLNTHRARLQTENGMEVSGTRISIGHESVNILS